MTRNVFMIIGIPTVLMAIISIGMPFYCRSILNQAGQKLLPLVRKKQIISHWITPILSYLLVILPFFINMGRFGLIIPYCGVAGLYIVLKESTFAPNSGVYENLLINSSTILKYETIKELPIEPQSNVLIMTNKNILFLGFLLPVVLLSCSTTKNVPDGDQLFVGLTKIDAYGYFTFALRYALLNDRLKLSLTAVDPFHQHITDKTSYYTNSDHFQKIHTNLHSHYIGLTATYSLGGKKVRAIDHDFTDSEQQRAEKQK